MPSSDGPTLYTFGEGDQTRTKQTLQRGLGTLGFIKQIGTVKEHGKKTDLQQIEGAQYDIYEYEVNAPAEMTILCLSRETSLPRFGFSGSCFADQRSQTRRTPSFSGDLLEKCQVRQLEAKAEEHRNLHQVEHTMTRILLTTTLLFAAFSASSAQAELVTFHVVWIGEFNPAKATASITIDDTVLPNPGKVSLGDFSTVGITSFTMTVSGSKSGNGTFTESDFDTVSWDSGNRGNATLDLTSELVGQPTGPLTLPWARGSGGFSLDRVPGSGAPINIGLVYLSTAGGDSLLLTNFTPVAVPEPSSMLLLGAMAMACFTRRRIRSRG